MKPSNPSARGLVLQFTPGGGLRAVNASLMQLILLAYQVEKFQVSGAPGWLDVERFDILAKPPSGAAGDSDPNAAAEPVVPSLSAVRVRLQGLLADRFQLRIRKESRQGTVLALTVARTGHKLRAAKDGMDGISGRPGHWTGEKVSMDLFARALSGVLGRPVWDRAALPDAYAFQLVWSPAATAALSPEADHLAKEKAGSGSGQEGTATSSAEGSPVFQALQEQLGLRLEPQRGAIPFLVVESAARPSSN